MAETMRNNFKVSGSIPILEPNCPIKKEKNNPIKKEKNDLIFWYGT